MNSLALIPADTETDCDLRLEDPAGFLLPEPCRTCPHKADPRGDLSTTPEQNAAYWKYQARNNRELLEKARTENEALKTEVRRLKEDLYGKKSEQGSQGSEVREAPRERRPRGHRKGVPSRGRTLHSDLPVLEEVRDLPESDRICPTCHKPYAPFGSETSEILEIEVRPHRRIIDRKRYRKSCSCPGEKGIKITPPPPRLIAKGKIGLSIGTEVLLFKYRHHLPLSRLLDSWEGRGLSLSAGTIAGGLKKIAPLFLPLYEAIVERSRTASFSQADETRYYVVDASRTRQWAWVILTLDTALYILDPSRGAKVPREHFADRPGILLVDRYGAYKAVTARQGNGLRLAFCWAHVRRDFLKATVKHPELSSWAGNWIRRIGRLFHETDGLRKGDPSARPAVREILSEMESTARSERTSRGLPPAATKVLKSLEEHWDGLTLFVDDPRIPLDNNASERALRGLVVGRKIFYGAGGLAMTLYSLFGTWEIGRLCLGTILSDYLEACARAGSAPSDLSPWLPWAMSSERRALLSRPAIRDPA